MLLKKKVLENITEMQINKKMQINMMTKRARKIKIKEEITI